MKVWHAVEIQMARVAETPVTTQLWSANTTGIEISEDSADAITMRAYFETAPDLEQLKTNILEGVRLCELPESSVHAIQQLTIADQDWLAEWKKGYEPVTIGEKLLITPSWKRDQLSSGHRAIVQIDPGMAFGTGTHETTRGCLELLEKYWLGDALLDVGTGTGILAIAAVKLIPGSHVIGFDVDPEAIDVAIENAEINDVTNEVDFEVNTISSFRGRSFDLVLANLTADVIIPLATEFPQVMRSNSILIVSGILREQGDEVCAMLDAQGLQVLETKPDGEWVTFALKFKR